MGADGYAVDLVVLALNYGQDSAIEIEEREVCCLMLRFTPKRLRNTHMPTFLPILYLDLACRVRIISPLTPNNSPMPLVSSSTFSYLTTSC